MNLDGMPSGAKASDTSIRLAILIIILIRKLFKNYNYRKKENSINSVLKLSGTAIGAPVVLVERFDLKPIEFGVVA